MFLNVTGVVPGMIPVEIMCGGNGRPSTVGGCPLFSSLLQQVRSYMSDSNHSRKGYKPYISSLFNYSKSKKYAKIRNWSNQNPNPALKTQTGNNLNYK